MNRKVIHSSLAGWDFMARGSLYLRYTNQNVNNSDKRSGDDVDFPDHVIP